MSLCGLWTLKGLSLSRVSVPLRWKRRGVGMMQPRLFGILKFLLKLFFLRGRLLKARFLRRISLKEEILLVLVDVPCV